MRRRLAWIAGLLGLAALARALGRRRQEAPPAPAPAAPDPADELRSVIAETERAAAAEAPEQSESLDERRRRVHERAQEALDAMKDPPAGA